MNDMIVRSSVYVTAGAVGLNGLYESNTANPPLGRGQYGLFAGPPFNAAGWAGNEKHRQDQQWSRKKREKERSPITHPAMSAAKSRQQTGDDISENGCCHDLTAKS
jgi:hypothetical protein